MHLLDDAVDQLTLYAQWDISDAIEIAGTQIRISRKDIPDHEHLMLAAYTADGRMLSVVYGEGDGNELTFVCAEVDNAAKLKLFYLNENYEPMGESAEYVL